MLGVLRFWLERGVDGFRVDALRQVLEGPGVARQPAEPGLPRRARTEYDSLLPVHSADHDDLAAVVAMARDDRRATTA